MLFLSIVSPVKKIFETDCSQVTVPTKMGLITILPKHTPLFSLLNHGEVTVKINNRDTSHLLVFGGFVNVSEDKVTLLVDYGIHSDDLDEKIIFEAKERAEKMVLESKSEELSKSARADLFHANFQLQFLLRHRKYETINKV